MITTFTPAWEFIRQLFEQVREPNKTDENRPYGIVRNRIYNYQGKYGGKNKEREYNGRWGNDGSSMVMPEKWNNPDSKNKRSVWSIATKPFPEAHFAVYPEELIESPIKAGCPEFVFKKFLY